MDRFSLEIGGVRLQPRLQPKGNHTQRHDRSDIDPDTDPNSGRDTRRGPRPDGDPDGGAAAQRPCPDPVLPEDPRRIAGGLPHAERPIGSPLCRQGAQPAGAGVQLCAPLGALGADRADDPRDRVDDVPDDTDRDRGAAAGAEPDQAAQAALQRAVARRQVVPQHPAVTRAPLSADQEAPRQAHREGQLLRPVRLGRRGEPDAEPAAAGVPAAQLFGRDLRIPDTAVPALPDQALLGALRRLYLGRRVRRADRRCRALPRRPDDLGPGSSGDRDGGGLGGAGVRARGGAARPDQGADPGAERPGHQPARRGRSRRHRRPYRGRAGLRAGVLHPGAPELGQPRLLSPHRRRGRARRRSWRRSSPSSTTTRCRHG